MDKLFVADLGAAGFKIVGDAHVIYGLAAAGLAGFMLTAVPNWTGAPPLRGAALAALALLWLVGRLTMTLDHSFPAPRGCRHQLRC